MNEAEPPDPHHSPTPERNPHAEAAAARTAEWAEGFGLLALEARRRQLDEERAALLAARLFPHAPFERLRLASDFATWWLWLDDLCDETALGSQPDALAARLHPLAAVLAGRRGPDPLDPFALALAELRGRLALASPCETWTSRFAATVASALEAKMWEASNRSRRVSPAVDTLVALRRSTGLMRVLAPLLAPIRGWSLPLALRQHDRVQRLHQAFHNVACWHNDLFSLSREQRQGDVHNLVLAIVAELDLPLSEAVALVTRFADEESATFATLAAEPSALDPDLYVPLREHALALDAMLRGHLLWCTETGRYAAPPDDLPERPRQGRLVLLRGGARSPSR